MQLIPSKYSLQVVQKIFFIIRDYRKNFKLFIDKMQKKRIMNSVNIFIYYKWSVSFHEIDH